MSIRTLIRKFKVLEIRIPNREHKTPILLKPLPPEFPIRIKDFYATNGHRSLANIYWYIVPVTDKHQYLMRCKTCGSTRTENGRKFHLNMNNPEWVHCFLCLKDKPRVTLQGENHTYVTAAFSGTRTGKT